MEHHRNKGRPPPASGGDMLGEGTREKGRGGVAAERDEHEGEGGGWGGPYGRPEEDAAAIRCVSIHCVSQTQPNPNLNILALEYDR